MAPQTQQQDDISSLAESKQTVTLNVGGTKYTTPWDLLSSSSALSNLAHKSYLEDPEAEVFIDRNGSRFEYCLDYLRDSEVVIPKTISKDAIIRDLIYYGVENPDSNALKHDDNVAATSGATSGAAVVRPPLVLKNGATIPLEEFANNFFMEKGNYLSRMNAVYQKSGLTAKFDFTDSPLFLDERNRTLWTADVVYPGLEDLVGTFHSANVGPGYVMSKEGIF